MSSGFIRVACRDCGTEQVMFEQATSIVGCSVCGATLATSTGGKANLVGCSIVIRLE